MDIELSVLDVPICGVRGGSRPARRILSDMVQLAMRVEALGYARYWLSEHHSLDSPLPSPEILIPLIAANTATIRVGVAGILLHFYSAFKVAENFRLLDVLFPDRIDLGLARGTTSKPIATALADGRTVSAEGDTYRQKVGDLLRYLQSREPKYDDDLWVPPMGGGMPEIWHLGSGTVSAKLAAEFGTSFSFARFLQADDIIAEQAIADYRSHFTCTAEMPGPIWSIAISGVCADSDKEARELLAKYPNRWLAERANVVGTVGCCRDMIEALSDQYNTRRFVFLTMCDDFGARLHSYELLAGAFGLANQGPMPSLARLPTLEMVAR